MEELGKRVDVVEEHIHILREQLNRRFDQLAVMITKHIPAAATQGNSSKEEEERQQCKKASLEAKLKQQRGGLRRTDKAVTTCRLPMRYRGVEHTF